jgi:hypothetical protein
MELKRRVGTESRSINTEAKLNGGIQGRGNS